MGKKEKGNSTKEKQKKRAKKTKIKIESTTKKEDGGRRIKSDANPSNVIHFDERKPIFYRKQANLSISLLPWSLTNCKQSVENSIRKMLLTYSRGLGGVLMSYDDVKLQDNEGSSTSEAKGCVLDDLPHVHYDVSCNVLVFSPSVGCELKGVVNKCFPSHVGILVFDYINAMISAETIRDAGYTFDRELQTWTMGSVSITSGVKINFIVTKIHECNGSISLEGAKPTRSLLVDTYATEAETTKIIE